MTRFIQQCACRGIRPASVVPERFASRPHLVSQLLRNRRVARFLVAPEAVFRFSPVPYKGL